MSSDKGDKLIEKQFISQVGSECYLQSNLLGQVPELPVSQPEQSRTALSTLLICRYVPMFGEVDFKPANAYSSVPIEEQMEALTKAVKAGKVRQIGLSNETAWGLTRFCQLGMTIFSVLDAHHGAWQCPCIMMWAIHLPVILTRAGLGCLQAAKSYCLSFVCQLLVTHLGHRLIVVASSTCLLRWPLLN